MNKICFLLKGKTSIFLFLFLCFLLYVINSSLADAQSTTKEEADKLFEEGSALRNQEEHFNLSKEKLEKALELYRKLNLIPEIVRTLVPLGNINAFMGNYVNAKAFLEEALKLSIENNLVEDEALIYHHLCEMMDDPKLGLIYAEKSLKLFQKLKSLGGEAMAYMRLGDIYRDNNMSSKAINCYEKSILLRRQVGDKVGLAYTLGALGSLETNIGNYGGAFKHQDEALRILIQSGIIWHIGLHYTSTALAAKNIGDYNRAKRYLEEAIRILTPLNVPPSMSDVLFDYASLLHDLGDHDQAIESYQESLEYYRRIAFQESLQQERVEGYTGWIMLHIGSVYLDQGKHSEALTLFQKYGGPLWLGKYYLVTKKYSLAREEFRQVLETPTGPDDHLIALIGLGKAAEEEKNYREARTNYQEAVNLIETQRQTIAGSERATFLGGKVFGFTRLEAYEGLVRCLYFLKKDTDAFLYSEYTKARSLLEALTRTAADNPFGVPPEVKAQEADFFTRFPLLEKQLNEALDQGDTKRQKALKKELKALEKEREAFLKTLRETYPEYAALAYPEPQPAKRLALKSDEVLLDYEVTDSLTLLFVVKKGKVQKTIAIPLTRTDLEEKVLRYRQGFEINTLSDLETLDLSLGYELYTLLLEKALQGVTTEKILLVPDEILSLLPFEGLPVTPPDSVTWESDKGRPFPQGITFLGETRVLSFYQSGSAFTLSRHLSFVSPSSSLLAVADPVFGAEDERVQRGDVTLAALPGDERVNTRREIAATVSEHVGEAVFLPLPSTSKMADDLKTIWKEVTVLSGLEASESRIKQTNLSRFGEVVFATHGIIDSRTPYLLEPALVLSSPDYTGEEGEDGYLTASEIMNLTFQTDTVAALACVTGLGKVVGGEGVMHLGRAFQYAGAKSALISLWSVEDESTNHLALTFFSALKQGKGKDQALLEARKSLMNQGYRHPFFWSSFILYGEER